MPTHLAIHQHTHFALWRPARAQPPPRLIIGTFQDGNPPTLAQAQQLDLAQSATHPDLWELPAASSNLTSGQVYHYWFEVTDDHPDRDGSRIRITDPTARTVDWRLLASRLPSPYDADDRDPAGVVMYQGGNLVPCDPGGEEPSWSGDASPASLPPNNRLVIYEMPTSWSRGDERDGVEIGVGSFRDVHALVDPAAPLANFEDLDAVRGTIGRLGVNALELLPPADSWVDREWGYATSNYFAADFDLGRPRSNSWPTATVDLVNLVKACHARGIRFFADVVMAFATRYSYEHVNYLDFHVRRGTGDPEEYKANGERREDFGGRLFKYNHAIQCYDPVSGNRGSWVPARRLMMAHLQRWMEDFGVDGVRIDSTPNIRSWDFLQEFKDHARQLWSRRWADAGLPVAGADERFLVVGEELPVNVEMVRQGRLDGLWNEGFLHRVKNAVIGRSWRDDRSFQETVERMIDCRRVGFADLSQAINYITSHDVEGEQKERLKDFFGHVGVWDAGKRARLAFACLLTAAGVPMILAGEEFADEHDRPRTHPAKQSDPVNYQRLARDDWRQDLFEYVARLVKLRTSYDALATNDTEFIHRDFEDGKRVVAWQRGRPDGDSLAVVVANFSDWGTSNPGSPTAEYRVNHWPSLPAGKEWFEVSQQRVVPAQWAGKEPLYPWEAKVYVLR